MPGKTAGGTVAVVAGNVGDGVALGVISNTSAIEGAVGEAVSSDWTLNIRAAPQMIKLRYQPIDRRKITA